MSFLHNPGCNCCTPTAHIIFSDEDSGLVRRYELLATGFTEIWSEDWDAVIGVSVEGTGTNYGPSFDGGGVLRINSTSTTDDGIYEFDLDTGASNGRLAEVGIPGVNMWQECAGACCYMSSSLRSVTSGGTVTTHSFGTTPACAIKIPSGDVWLVLGTNEKIRNHNNTADRADLTSVMVDSNDLIALVSDDGEDIYVLGIKADRTVVELFHVDTSGTGTLLASHACSGTAHNCTFTKLGDFLFWKIVGHDKIWRYTISTDTLDAVVTRTSGSWTATLSNASCGESFFALA